MLAEHTTNAEESLILQLQGMQTKSEAMRVDGVHFTFTARRARESAPGENFGLSLRKLRIVTLFWEV